MWRLHCGHSAKCVREEQRRCLLSFLLSSNVHLTCQNTRAIVCGNDRIRCIQRSVRSTVTFREERFVSLKPSVDAGWNGIAIFSSNCSNVERRGMGDDDAQQEESDRGSDCFHFSLLCYYL